MSNQSSQVWAKQKDMFQTHKKMCSKSQWVKHLNLPTNLIIISGKCASNLSGATLISQMFRTNGHATKEAIRIQWRAAFFSGSERFQTPGRAEDTSHLILKLASSQVPVSPFQKQTTNFSGKASWGTSALSAIFFKLWHLVTSLQRWTQVRG